MEDVQKWANLIRHSWPELVSRLRRSRTRVGKLASALLPTLRVLSVTGSNALVKNHGVSRIQRSSCHVDPCLAADTLKHTQTRAHKHTGTQAHLIPIPTPLEFVSDLTHALTVCLWKHNGANTTVRDGELEVGWSHARPKRKELETEERRSRALSRHCGYPFQLKASGFPHNND